MLEESWERTKKKGTGEKEQCLKQKKKKKTERGRRGEKRQLFFSSSCSPPFSLPFLFSFEHCPRRIKSAAVVVFVVLGGKMDKEHSSENAKGSLK